MKKQHGDALIGFSIFGMICLFLVAVIIDAWACHSKWDRAGMAGVSYGPIQGCLVKLPDGRWLPEERIREIDIPKEPQK